MQKEFNNEENNSSADGDSNVEHSEAGGATKSGEDSYLDVMTQIHQFIMSEKTDRAGKGDKDGQVLKKINKYSNVGDVVKNSNDVLFVKYDTINMKYLYKCCVCSTSWKNKE